MRTLTETELQAVSATLHEIEHDELDEYQYLFALVGHLRGAIPGSRQSDRRFAMQLIPVAIEFAKQVELNALGSGTIDWTDEDVVELEFVKSWTTRKFPKESRIFDQAIAISAINPLGLSEERNRWVNRIANLAFCLSELLPDTPTLIPVNDKTAAKLGVSLRTLSLAIQEAIREKLIIVVSKGDQALPARIARKYKFNSKHPLVATEIDGSRRRVRDEMIRLDTTTDRLDA